MMFRPVVIIAGFAARDLASASGDASPRMSVQSHSEFFLVRHPKLNATQPTLTP